MKKSPEGWRVVFSSGTDYEADLVRSRLDDAGIDAVVMTQRDHAFNLTVGDLAKVHVLVAPDDEGRAHKVLAEAPLTDEELAKAAAAADPHAPPAHDKDDQAILDSGIDRIRFSPKESDDTAKQPDE